MSTEEGDPLEELVVDRRHVSKVRVVDALDGVVNVDTEGDVVKSSGFSELNSKQRIVALLLARWVAAELGLIGTPVVDIEELSAQVGLADGSVRRYLGDLAFVAPSQTGPGFSISDNRILDAVEFLEERATPASRSTESRN